MNGYTKKEAEVARAEGERVVGCWFCVNRGEARPYYKESDTMIHQGEHIIRCPKHADRSEFP